MSQVKFSQGSIYGLKEALAALLAQINTNATAGSTALMTAINAEIAARQSADTAISNLLDTVNGDSTVDGSFRKAIADVIGSAPEALNTLKEISDYIAVNPSANVADAINAAIAAANQSVTDLTAVVTAEKTYLDSIVSTIPVVTTEIYYPDDSTWAGQVNSNGDRYIFPNDATGTVFSQAGTHSISDVLNYGTLRFTKTTENGTRLSFDLEIESSEGVNPVFVNAETWADMGSSLNGFTIFAQYIKHQDGATVRTALGG